MEPDLYLNYRADTVVNLGNAIGGLTSGGGNLGDKLNGMAGGGAQGEANEDYLDKGGCIGFIA